MRTAWTTFMADAEWNNIKRVTGADQTQKAMTAAN